MKRRKRNGIKRLGLTIAILGVLTTGYDIYANNINAQNESQVEELQEENNKLIEEIQSIKDEHSKCEDKYTQLEINYGDKCDIICDLEDKITELEQQIEDMKQEETEKPGNNEGGTDGIAYGTRSYGDPYDNYYHDYSDCPFIDDKTVYELSDDEILNRYDCKCVHHGIESMRF